MENQQQAKRTVKVRRLKLGDEQALMVLLQDQQLAASAGLQLMADSALQQWAVENWLTNDELFGIEAGSQLIGLVAIFPIDTGGEIGYFLQPSYWRRGIMTMAVLQVQRLTTHHQLVAEVELANQASQRVLTKTGFNEQGRNHQLITYRWERDGVC